MATHVTKGYRYVDAYGKPRTGSLFYEFRVDGYEPIWTLSEQDRTIDGKTYPSLMKMYLECRDPTEYRFAMELLGSWSHWSKMCRTNWFGPHVEHWREVLEVKLRSEGIQKMMENTDYLKAAQWLAECGWKEKKASKKVRKELEQAQRVIDQVRNQVDDDADRLGITEAQ